MPIYEYQCRTCGKRTELLQRMDDPPLAACPECGGEVKKLISSPAVQFKGSGWYVTDYSNKLKPPSEGEKPPAAAGEKKEKETATGSSAAPPASPSTAPASGSSSSTPPAASPSTPSTSNTSNTSNK